VVHNYVELYRAAICAERLKLGVELTASFPVNFGFRTMRQVTLRNWVLSPIVFRSNVRAVNVRP